MTLARFNMQMNLPGGGCEVVETCSRKGGGGIGLKLEEELALTQEMLVVLN